MRYLFLFFLLLFNAKLKAQQTFKAKFDSFKKLEIDSGITLTFDEPDQLKTALPTKLIIFALPNGNTTAQSFGKQLAPGDDWHFDIQHIGAQTAFIRKADPQTNYIVVYAENSLKAWPAWRRKFANSDERIANLVKLIESHYAQYHPQLILTSHSGGGSFIFGYINAQQLLPANLVRIGFLDATYGYETDKHQSKLANWLKLPNKSLQVIAYNDSVVTYNGKPLVSPTGGTWYRSQLLAKDLVVAGQLQKQEFEDRISFRNRQGTTAFILIKNPAAKIFHTVLVEKNGFIQLVLAGTKFEDKGYKFWKDRAYASFILP
ncbi:hypothetical protein [Pedobacter sp. ASV12]|uniref:hypothetical protein n=1 Tax=Pedobacter sp. ASV12 TaxID=2795120 RepID=UPI0018EE269F|nr:hypothetical protein [Pedobacter sp. ASV12]